MGVVFITAVIVGVVLGTAHYGESGPVPAPLEGFTLDEVINGKFAPDSFNGTWISGNEFIYRDYQNAISIYDVESKKRTEVLGRELVSGWRISSFWLSNDRKFLLFNYNVQHIFRYSTSAYYAVVELATNKLYALQPTQYIRENAVPLRYAAWNPQTNGIAYVYNNDIYYRSSPEILDGDVRVTVTGEEDTFFNGIPDWVYEEEVLGSDHAMWFSQDGQRLAFASFDDHLVDAIEFPVYGPVGSTLFQYPVTKSIRYPKPGRHNPIVNMWTVNLPTSHSHNVSGHRIPAPVGLNDMSTNTTNPLVNMSVALLADLSAPITTLGIPAALVDQDHYFTAVTWTTNDEVMVIWTNRHQNVSYISFCNASSGTCEKDKSFEEPNGWVDMYIPPKFSADGQRFLLMLPIEQGTAGNFKHVVLLDRANFQGSLLSTGKFEVTEILGWDEKREMAYFIGTEEGKPAVRQFYQVSTNQLSPDTAPPLECVTCGRLNEYGENCTYNRVEFSTDLSYYVHNCDGPGVPRSGIKKTLDHSEIFLVANNSDLRARLAQKLKPSTLNLQVPVTGGYNAQVRLLLPPSFNRNMASQYPLLVYVYGGPQSQQVADNWKIDWGTHLSSSKGVIYALIDGRGSGYQGDKMLQEIYRRMGTVEIEDQIAVTKYLVENLPFVDGNRTAIWGWSYGGFATAMTLARDTEKVFKCGMSVAPVTSWIYYDSIYTERYMGLPTPDDNEFGYNNSDVTRLVENLRNKPYYLLHGTADDNVHYQQSMLLGRALEQADILFRQQSYTDENHSILNLKMHLYHSLDAFLMGDCFKMEEAVWG